MFVHEVGLTESILEGDSELVINCLRDNDMLHSCLGHLVKDTMSYVNPLRSWSFSRSVRLDLLSLL